VRDAHAGEPLFLDVCRLRVRVHMIHSMDPLHCCAESIHALFHVVVSVLVSLLSSRALPKFQTDANPVTRRCLARLNVAVGNLNLLAY